jgi:hypothetical protein
MSWQPYELDRQAQKLVLKYRDKQDGDKQEVLQQSFKMRQAVAYGLERFWGEHLRLKRDQKTQEQSKYWWDTWKTLADILQPAGISLPVKVLSYDQYGKLDTAQIEEVTRYLWEQLTLDDRRVAIAVLTGLCDCLVWWTQRYKLSKEN